MSFDLLLTNSGDLSFINSYSKYKEERFQYNFHVAPTNSLLFNFDVLNNNDFKIKSGNYFNFNFFTYTPQFDKINRVVKDTEYIQQAIKIRLDTELGTVKGEESLGSTLYAVLHSNLQKSKILSEICKIVKAAISDILYDVEIEAYFVDSDYLNFHDTIKIVITNNEEVYYYFI